MFVGLVITWSKLSSFVSLSEMKSMVAISWTTLCAFWCWLVNESVTSSLPLELCPDSKSLRLLCLPELVITLSELSSHVSLSEWNFWSRLVELIIFAFWYWLVQKSVYPGTVSGFKVVSVDVFFFSLWTCRYSTVAVWSTAQVAETCWDLWDSSKLPEVSYCVRASQPTTQYVFFSRWVSSNFGCKTTLLSYDVHGWAVTRILNSFISCFSWL